MTGVLAKKKGVSNRTSNIPKNEQTSGMYVVSRINARKCS